VINTKLHKNHRRFSVLIVLGAITVMFAIFYFLISINMSTIKHHFCNGMWRKLKTSQPSNSTAFSKVQKFYIRTLQLEPNVGTAGSILKMRVTFAWSSARCLSVGCVWAGSNLRSRFRPRFKISVQPLNSQKNVLLLTQMCPVSD
jgi:hypothetical protein